MIFYQGTHREFAPGHVPNVQHHYCPQLFVSLVCTPSSLISLIPLSFPSFICCFLPYDSLNRRIIVTKFRMEIRIHTRHAANYYCSSSLSLALPLPLPTLCPFPTLSACLSHLWTYIKCNATANPLLSPPQRNPKAGAPPCPL